LPVKQILKDTYLPQRVVLKFNWFTFGNSQRKIDFKHTGSLTVAVPISSSEALGNPDHFEQLWEVDMP